MKIYKLFAMAAALLMPTLSHSQIVRPYDERVSFNVNGNIALIGNTLLTCTASTSCANTQAGVTAVNNNSYNMINVNVDPAAVLANSSSANLLMPQGSTVLYAGLYWAGMASETNNNRANLKIKSPSQTNYTNVTADVLDTIPNVNTASTRPYQAMADVTNVILAGGNGTYTVGGLTALTGTVNGGAFGGWSLAVIYQDNNQPFRRLMLFDGAANVGGNNTVSVDVNGLLTPTNGSFDTYIGALTWEGDAGITGDALTFEGTTLNQNINSANNFWNGSISLFDSHVTNKTPNYVNQLTMDIDMVDVSNLLGNSATEANIQFSTGGDGYYPHYLAFVTELYLPDFGSTMSKTANDINGGTIAAGDVIEYTISLSNSGQDGASNTTLIDPLPAHTTYVNNSMRIISADVGATGSQSDAGDSDVAEYDALNNQVVFRLGDGGDDNIGGTFLTDQGATVKFRVTIDNNAPLGDIVNTATVTSNSFIFPSESFSASKSATVNLGDNQAPNPPVIIAPSNGSVLNDNQPVISGTAEPGATINVIGPNGESCTTVVNAGGGWSCQIAPSLPDGNQLLSVTATDTAGNVSPAATTEIEIDTSAPNAAVCTVTPNPANNGTTVTATCTSVELGATVTIPGYLCSAENNGEVVCTGIVGVDGVDGDETATTTDAAGNSSDSDAFFTLDNSPPADPTITSPTSGSSINNNTPLITGTGEPGSIITVSGPNGESCTVTVDINGDWGCSLNPALQDGSNTITATAADAAGNESATDSINLTINSGQAYELTINAANELVTTEMGGTDSFSVSLPLTPAANVTVDFSSSDAGEGSVSPASVTFTPNNWNTPVDVTVTGVDDSVYDLDQSYQIIIAPLTSADTNYHGYNPANIEAVNIDDDESPDLSVFISNCVAGVNPNDTMTYQVLVSNTGNKDIIGATVATVMDNNMSAPNWICQTQGNASCDLSNGNGNLNQSVSINAGSSLLFLLDSQVTGPLNAFIDVEASVTMPQGETDVDTSNNVAFDSDLIYAFIYKNGFDCAAPGSIESTQQLLETMTQ